MCVTFLAVPSRLPLLAQQGPLDPLEELAAYLAAATDSPFLSESELLIIPALPLYHGPSNCQAFRLGTFRHAQSAMSVSTVDLRRTNRPRKTS